MKKTALTSRNRWYKKPQYIIPLSVLVFVLSILVYQFTRTEIDRYQFKKIEKDMKMVQKELAEQNPQMKTEMVKSCGQDVQEFGGGKIYCSIEIDSRNKYTEDQLVSIVPLNYKIITKSEFKPVRPPDVSNRNWDAYVEQRKGGFDCSVGYQEHYPVEDTRYALIFSCTRYVYKYIYPGPKIDRGWFL